MESLQQRSTLLDILGHKCYHINIHPCVNTAMQKSFSAILSLVVC